MGNATSEDKKALLGNESSSSSSSSAQSQYGYQRLQEEPERNYGGGSEKNYGGPNEASGSYWSATWSIPEKAKQEEEEQKKKKAAEKK